MKENRDKVCYDERERETMRARGATDREENAGSVCITRINVRYDEVGPVWRNGACSDRKDEGPEDERRREKSRKWERALRGPTGIGWHSVGPGVSLRRPRRRLRCGIVGCWKSREALRGLCRRNKQSARSSSCERPLGSLRRLSARPWTGPVWSMPLTRTKDAAATFASAAAPPPLFLSLSLSLSCFSSCFLLCIAPLFGTTNKSRKRSTTRRSNSIYAKRKRMHRDFVYANRRVSRNTVMELRARILAYLYIAQGRRRWFLFFAYMLSDARVSAPATARTRWTANVGFVFLVNSKEAFAQKSAGVMARGRCPHASLYDIRHFYMLHFSFPSHSYLAKDTTKREQGEP